MSSAGIRNAWFSALLALLLGCVFTAAARAQDDAAAKTSATVSSGTASAQHSSSTATNTKGKTTTASSKKRRKKSTQVRGQQKIDPQRAQEIQEALIREHYLSGQATGTWNEASEEAMRRYQADNGWQSKTVPDSRALIKLGLGPSKDHLLNPESAMTTAPDPPKSESAPPTSHSAPAGAEPATPSATPGSTAVSSNPSSPQ
jgi:Putative peptidoglycan binding domain